MSIYAWVLLLSGIVPLVVSGYPGLRFWRHGRALAASLALVVAVFGAWDVYAAAAGHWWFDPRGVWPLRIFGLPLEEVLFFVVIPFCCLLLWEVVCYFTENRK